MCDCTTEPESTSHFLMRCPFYTQQRAKLMFNLRNERVVITAEILLKGSETLSRFENEQIIKAVLVYINETARF
jgi:hypothetical protein